MITGRNEVLAKVIFSQACVILSTGGGLVRYPPLQAGTPQAGTPPPGRHPPSPGRHPPLSRQAPPPPGRHPPENWEQAPPPKIWSRHPPRKLGTGTPPENWEQAPPPKIWSRPPPKIWSRIRSTLGRYASYWNAFLFFMYFLSIFLSISR